MTFVFYNCFLLSNQDTNWYFGVGTNKILDILFVDKKFYQLN